MWPHIPNIQRGKVGHRYRQTVDGSERESHRIFKDSKPASSGEPLIISVIRQSESKLERRVGRHSFGKRQATQLLDRADHSPHLPFSIESKDRMGWISDIADEDSLPEASSSKIRITNGASCPQNTGGRFTERSAVADNENPLADFAFDKLPTELLVKIFHHARADSVLEACATKYPYPIALTQVCHHWRNVALGAPTLWTDIRIVQCDTEEIRGGARVYLERSKTCPIFLTWFADPDQPYAKIQGVIRDLIIPGAERWQRITLLAGNNTVVDALLTAMESLDFPTLQDVEISCLFIESSPSNPTFCRSAPLLRRCRFRSVPSLPPLPSSLVILDCIFSALELTEFDLDPLLEFLPHVAHSLEHLQFGPPSASKVRFTPRTSRIPLEHLKSLLIKDSHVIMDHISTPNLAYFLVLHPLEADTMDAAKVFEGFSAPALRSMHFYVTPLLPILNAHNLSSMFPQLESITLSGCTDESTFALLLEPPKPKKPSSLQKASKHPPKQRKAQNPFPNLKELTISDMTAWTSLQAAIEKRLKNGDKSLKKIQLPKEEATEAIMSHLRRWIPAQGIELVLYEPGELSVSPPEFQDDFCDEEIDLFLEIVEWNERERYEEDYISEYWEGRDVFPPDYELPSHLDPNQYYWDEFHDGYDDEEEEEDEEDDFYEG